MSINPQLSVVRLIAEVLAGTQVPRSLGALGAATKPWDVLRNRLHVFGYLSSDEYEQVLRKVITDIKTTTL